MVDKAYKTEKKEELRRINKAGDIETYYRVWATSKGGTYYHVDINESDLAQADALLTEKAKALDTI